jgi:hypothetical protein
MYKLKEKYKELVKLNAWTSLDINGTYSLETWIKSGFKTYVLEKIN